MSGDRVELVARPDGALVLLAVRERGGVADDRSSARFRWVRARSRAELQRSLDAVSPVGALTGLSVGRRGVSGRVAALEVTGTGGRAVIEGFRLRRALDLPETLFTIDAQHEPNGLIRRVLFHGRGWGHGVGLCQVGAFGMAGRGASFREILQHYYTDVQMLRMQEP
ncbi:MAG: hypothetical protein JSV80_11665 [Acidobacteriota bacterium]|nr:MAG: hypothetical protein JSV80_11665 [Acidobacteriota bacterium]